MPQTDVIEADSRDLVKEFVRFPARLYRGDPHYIRPLDSERLEFLDHSKNPFFSGARTRLFLARRDGQTVGRISTCVYFAHNELHHEQVGFFGFFDTIDDSEVSQALLKVALITLKQEGMKKMRGPASFSLNHECGFLVEGFDIDPVLMMPYNRPCQPRLAEEFGLKKVMDMYAYMLTSDDIKIDERVRRLVGRISERSKVTIRGLNMRRYSEEVDLINRLYNTAWETNWGFVPMTPEEFRYTAAQMKQIIDPDLALIAVVGDKPIGFSLSLPDLNQALKYLNGKLLPLGVVKLLWHTKIRNKVRGLRTIIMGILPEFQKKGIDLLMHVQTYERGVRKGYRTSELSWVLESNEQMHAVAEGLGARRYKTYRLVEIPI